MARTEIEPDTSTYGGKVAARIRELRKARGWTVQQLREELLAAGLDVKVKTLYAYEVGKARRGADLPMELVPYFAVAFGYKSSSGWLP